MDDSEDRRREDRRKADRRAESGFGATKATRPSRSKRIIVRVSAVQKPPGTAETYGERISAVRAIGASTGDRLRRVDTLSVIISISDKDC